MGAAHGFKENLAKKGLSVIELTFLSDQFFLYLACYDMDQLKQWLSGI